MDNNIKLKQAEKQFLRMKLVPLKHRCVFNVVILCLLSISYDWEVTGEKILFLSFVSTRSHQNIYEPLLLELAKRGHNVTLVTPIKTGKIVQNLREINTPSIDQDLEQHVRSVYQRKQQSGLNSTLQKFLSMPFLSGERFASICRQSYEAPQIKDLIENSKKDKFDLVFLKTFQNECTYGLAHYLNTTTILMTTVSPFRWNAAAFGGFYPPSFVPGFAVPFTHNMNFIQRVFNFIGEVLVTAIRHVIYLPIMEKVYKDVFGEGIPSSYEIERNASLLLINSVPILNYPRPHMPDMIEIGGMHIKTSKPLPKDLEKFAMDSDTYDGFIYFSMGSILKSHMMPEKTRHAFLAAFSKLKQRVIWKWETDQLDDLPENVKIVKWLPQQDLLAHRNIRAFITHGGLLSIQEASYYGVPIIGIPMFGDQSWNMNVVETLSFGLTLDFETLDENKITTALTSVIDDPKYRKGAQELSRIIKDQPMSPLMKAVYWTEYVLRYQGATHLRSAGRHLHYWQYHSFDIVATICAAIAVLLAIVPPIVKFILKFMFRRCAVFKNLRVLKIRVQRVASKYRGKRNS